MYEIGPFRLDPDAGVLTHLGAPVPLGARAVAVLATLVKHRNEHVSKSTILGSAWPGLVVEDSNISVQVSAIRRVLKRAPGGDRWVETLSRRGYRFVGPVNEIERSDGSPLPPRTNLPASLTSFVGRQRETVDVEALLASARFVTLIGIGGIGKTRLAQRVAGNLAERFSDGVWFVDLAPVTDAKLVPNAVAQVLRVQEAAGRSLVNALCGQLKDRALLLVLDNCEHLLDECARFAEAVLRAAPGVKILATSREPLRLDGEQCYAVPTLGLPDPEATPETIADSDAVRLFIERVRLRKPGFTPEPPRIPTIARICVRLDGIPLALELAAARTGSLSLEEIHARLDDRFKLLTLGPRTALPRQQTLRAAMEWSNDLLSAPKRSLLSCCAIFAGGFTLEAVTFVASSAPFTGDAVTDLLSQLVASSLVIADTDRAGTRYRLLETTRAYALENLRDARQANELRRRHAQYFKRLFENAPRDWLRMTDVEWRAKYVVELDNVRAALDWAIEAEPRTALSLAGTSARLWSTVSLFGEGARRLEAAVEHIEPHTPTIDRARVWFWLGMLLDAAPMKALAANERAVELYRDVGDAVERAHAYVRLAHVLTAIGRLRESAAALEEAYPALDDANLPKALGFYFTNLAYLRMAEADPVSATLHYEKALALYREAGADLHAIDTLGNLADASWASGKLDSAEAALRETIATLRKTPMSRKRSLGYCLMNLAGVLVEKGELEAALAPAREGLPLVRDGGYAWLFLDHFAFRAAARGHLESAARLAGYVDALHAAAKSPRQPNEGRSRTRVQCLLEQNLDAESIARLTAEGAILSEEEACRLALQ